MAGGQHPQTETLSGKGLTPRAILEIAYLSAQFGSRSVMLASKSTAEDIKCQLDLSYRLFLSNLINFDIFNINQIHFI